MSIPRTIRNFNAFVDGRTYFGRATEAKLPDVKIITEAHRGGGMAGPVGIDMGVEGMTSEITFAEWDPVLFKHLGKKTKFVLRPAQLGEDNFDADVIVASITGLITSPGLGDLKVGSSSSMKLIMDVRAFAFEINGEELINIDLVAGIRRVGGVDQMASMRRAMGI